MKYLPISSIAAATCLAAALLPSAASTTAGHTPQPAPQAIVEPAARQALDAMARAYRDVPEFEQETTYSGESAGGGIRRLRLVVQKPNRLLMELWQAAPEKPDGYLTRFQSDGKTFYTYQERNGWYTKVKAPKSYRQFDFLAVNLEMAALTGLDPVATLLRNATTVRLESPMDADGGLADVVAVGTGTGAGATTVRLFISQRDHMLRRFAIEAPAPNGDAGTAATPAAQSGSATGSVVYAYDNHVETRRPPKDAFVWVAPSGVYQKPEYANILDPTHRSSQIQENTRAALPPGMKPMKIISLKDLMKHARKPN